MSAVDVYLTKLAGYIDEMRGASKDEIACVWEFKIEE
jgi:hypothetical protein